MIRSEKINQLEQFSSDFKSSQKDLQTFLDVLNDTKTLVKLKKENLKGLIKHLIIQVIP